MQGIGYQNRSPIQHPAVNFGSTPHLGQALNFAGPSYGGGSSYTMRSPDTNRDYPLNPYVDDKGRYMNLVPQHVQYEKEMNSHPLVRTNSFSPTTHHRPSDAFTLEDARKQSQSPLPIQMHMNMVSRDTAQQSFYNSGIGNTLGSPPPQRFYLHGEGTGNGSPPVVPQRRTWAQPVNFQGKSDGSAGNLEQDTPQKVVPNSAFIVHPNGLGEQLSGNGRQYSGHISSSQQHIMRPERKNSDLSHVNVDHKVHVSLIMVCYWDLKRRVYHCGIIR